MWLARHVCINVPWMESGNGGLPNEVMMRPLKSAVCAAPHMCTASPLGSRTIVDKTDGQLCYKASSKCRPSRTSRSMSDAQDHRGNCLPRIAWGRDPACRAVPASPDTEHGPFPRAALPTTGLPLSASPSSKACGVSRRLVVFCYTTTVESGILRSGRAPRR